MLTVENLVAGYGKVQVLHGISLEVQKGQLVTLRKTGDLAKYVTYVAIGTRLRVALGVKYAKYQIGKRPVYPRQEQGLPESYVRALMRVAVDVVSAETHK